MKEKNLTSQEIISLRQLIDKINEIKNELGELEIQYANNKQRIFHNLSIYLQEQEELGKKLSFKYGEGEIDLEKGTIKEAVKEG